MPIQIQDHSYSFKKLYDLAKQHPKKDIKLIQKLIQIDPPIAMHFDLLQQLLYWQKIHQQFVQLFIKDIGSPIQYANWGIDFDQRYQAILKQIPDQYRSLFETIQIDGFQYPSQNFNHSLSHLDYQFDAGNLSHAMQQFYQYTHLNEDQLIEQISNQEIDYIKFYYLAVDHHWKISKAQREQLNQALNKQSRLQALNVTEANIITVIDSILEPYLKIESALIVQFKFLYDHHLIGDQYYYAVLSNELSPYQIGFYKGTLSASKAYHLGKFTIHSHRSLNFIDRKLHQKYRKDLYHEH